MKLIGFTFIKNQKEFEEWQLDNENYSVHTVQPHMMEMAVKSDGAKYDIGQDVITQWGVFVTYSYDAT